MSPVIMMLGAGFDFRRSKETKVLQKRQKAVIFKKYSSPQTSETGGR